MRKIWIAIVLTLFTVIGLSTTLSACSNAPSETSKDDYGGGGVGGYAGTGGMGGSGR